MSIVDFGPPDAGAVLIPREVSVVRVAGNLSAMEMLVRRWFGCWVDFLVLAALLFLPSVLTGSLMGGTAAGSASTAPENGAAALIGVLAMLAYFPITEGLWGRSLGKLLSGTVVVTKTGAVPGVWRALLRTLLRLIEVNPFLLGGIPAAIFVAATSERRRLGDLRAGTYVVPADALKVFHSRKAESMEATSSVFD
jgi:uncharacterized RDD family membrane protein YckC